MTTWMVRLCARGGRLAKLGLAAELMPIIYLGLHLPVADGYDDDEWYEEEEAEWQEEEPEKVGVGPLPAHQ